MTTVSVSVAVVVDRVVQPAKLGLMLVMHGRPRGTTREAGSNVSDTWSTTWYNP